LLAREAALRLKPRGSEADLSPMRLLARSVAAAGLAAGLASHAYAEIYRWTDARGNEHFTQDLSQVPASARADAERTARAESQRSSPNSAAAAVARTPRTRVSATGVLQIPFEKQGNAMIVYARVNDAVTAPFIVDTGASDVLVPAHVAQAAGIEVGRDTPHQTYQTANGLVETPVVTISSIQVGEARVENLRGSVSGGMSIGLLGGTFFNNFTFQVDPAANLITLFPNALVRGGANQDEWRARFRELHATRASIDEYLAQPELPDLEEIAAVKARREAVAAELAALDEEANRASVPQAWRD
jgi:clan AA aspartic protease (TIGR02281 family)